MSIVGLHTRLTNEILDAARVPVTLIYLWDYIRSRFFVCRLHVAVLLEVNIESNWCWSVLLRIDIYIYIYLYLYLYQ